MWIDISHTVKAAELKGGKLFKHMYTGETRLEEPEPLTPEMEGSEPNPEITPMHHSILDDAEQEYLEQKAADAEQKRKLSEIESTTVQNRRGKKRGS